MFLLLVIIMDGKFMLIYQIYYFKFVYILDIIIQKENVYDCEF